MESENSTAGTPPAAPLDFKGNFFLKKKNFSFFILVLIDSEISDHPVLSVGTEEMSGAAGGEKDNSPPAVDGQRSGNKLISYLSISLHVYNYLDSDSSDQPAAIIMALSGIFFFIIIIFSSFINKANHIVTNLHVDGEAAALSSDGAAIIEPIVNLIPPTPEKLEAASASSSSLAPPIAQLRLNTRSRTRTRSPSPSTQLDVPTEVPPLRRSSRSRSGTPRP